MIWQEFQNIKKLETNKVREVSEIATISSLNKLLLNILFDQIKVSMKFDSTY